MQLSRFFFARLAEALCLTALVGCRFVAAPPVALIDGIDTPAAIGANSSATTKAAPRTIPIEITFVRHLDDDPQLTDELWRLADEQLLPVEVRRRLNANGLGLGSSRRWSAAARRPVRLPVVR